MTRGNGTVTSYGYDAVSRLGSPAHDLAGTTYDVTTTFAYNPAAQLASNTRNSDRYAWNGQVAVSRGCTPNGLNEYTAVGGVGFSYDANGNLTSDGTNTFTYDVEYRLVGRTPPHDHFSHRQTCCDDHLNRQSLADRQLP